MLMKSLKLHLVSLSLVRVIDFIATAADHHTNDQKDSKEQAADVKTEQECARDSYMLLKRSDCI